MPFFKRREYPEYYQAYLDTFKSTWKKSVPVRNLRFVVMDTEATGLKIGADRLLSIGLVRIINQQIPIEESWECLVNPNGGQVKQQSVIEKLQKAIVRKGSILIHGIRGQDSVHGLEEKEAIKQLLERLKDDILIGHHIGFDVGMINEALKRQGLPKIKNIVLDTAQLAHRLINPLYTKYSPSIIDLSLDALSRKYGITMHDRHTAAGDAFITAYLFLKILAKLEQRGVKTLADLLK